jgi:hypothetical protein
MLKALVIVPDEKMKTLEDVFAAARAAARTREKTKRSPRIRSLGAIFEFGVYIAIYEIHDKPRSNVKQTG